MVNIYFFLTQLVSLWLLLWEGLCTLLLNQLAAHCPIVLFDCCCFVTAEDSQCLMTIWYQMFKQILPVSMFNLSYISRNVLFILVNTKVSSIYMLHDYAFIIDQLSMSIRLLKIFTWEISQVFFRAFFINSMTN